MGTRLSGCERRNAMQFLKTSSLFLWNVLVLLVLLPFERLRLTFGLARQPVKVHR
jgi:hypothetical protein